MFDANSTSEAHAALLVVPGVLKVVGFFGPAAFENTLIECRRAQKIELLSEAVNIQPAHIQAGFDSVLSDLVINIAPHAELRASFVLKRFVQAIGVPGSRPQTEYSSLPEQMRIACEAPVSIQQQVSGIGVKD